MSGPLYGDSPACSTDEERGGRLPPLVERADHRVLDSRSRGCGYEPHQRHCIVSLSKTLYPLLSTGSNQEDPSRHELKKC